MKNEFPIILYAGFFGMILLFITFEILKLDLKLYNIFLYWDVYLSMQILFRTK